MNNKLLLLICSILFISFASAIYPGQTYIYEHNFGTEQIVWTILNNTLEQDQLPDITFNTTHIIIYFQPNMPPINLTMVFLNNFTQEVVNTIVVSSGSSGGHSTKTITKYVNNTIEKEVPTYIPEYIQNKTTEYINKTIVKEKIVNKGEVKWFMVILGLLAVIGILWVLFHFMNKFCGYYFIL